MRIRHRETEFELDLTTFINLMVVLLSFLLISSVVREVSVLKVNLPAAASASASPPAHKPLILEVMILNDQLLVSDRQSGPLKSIPDRQGQHDYAALNTYLRTIKAQYPGLTEATLLMQATTPYNDLIHTMDAVRYQVEDIGGQDIHMALFPDIALGDAPAQSSGAPHVP